MHYVVDGGYLLHTVRWHPSINMCDIRPLYGAYLAKMKSVEVVFDGYPAEACIKDHEHARQAPKVTYVGPHKLVTENSKNIRPQELFLASIGNKKVLLRLSCLDAAFAQQSHQGSPSLQQCSHSDCFCGVEAACTAP